MNTYVCIEINTLHHHVVKAANHHKAFEALKREMGPISRPRVIDKDPATKQVFVHYNKVNPT